MIDLNDFTYNEVYAAADELGINLLPSEAKIIAVSIVTSRFPICLRQHLKENYV